MNIQKIIAVVLSLALVCGAAVGGIQYYKSYQEKNQIVEVQPVSNLNWGYWGDSMTSYGMVTNDSAQEIYLEDSKKVEEVYVKEGDTVKKGDPLIRYDSSELKIEIQRKELSHSNLLNNIGIVSHALEELRQTTPVDKTPPEINSSLLDDEEEDFEEQETKKPERDERDSRIYNYVTEDSVPYNADTADGSEKNPYIYYCNADVYAYGSFFNSIRPDGDEKSGKYVKFIICKKDKNGKMVFEEQEIEDTEDDEKKENEDSKDDKDNKDDKDDKDDTDNKNDTDNKDDKDDTDNKNDTDNKDDKNDSDDKQENDGADKEEESMDSPDRDTVKEPESEQKEEAEKKEEARQTEAEKKHGEVAAVVTVEQTVYLSKSEDKAKTRVPAADGSISPNTIVYNGNNFPTEYDDDRMWYVFSGEEVGDTLEDLFDQIEEEQEWEEPEGYSEQELAEAIREKEEALKSMDLERRKSELELESLRNTQEDGMVYAKIDGIVKSVGDLEDADNGDAFLVLTGDGGLYVKGTVSELHLDLVQPGTIITANSWETGNTFEATVTEISDYPVPGDSWGEGNTNVSYYQYTAHIEDSSALKNGEYVDLSIAQENTEEMEDAIYIEKAYIREENGKSYCMIADENGRLKKQYVQTGKTVYGSAVEIKAGLLETDLIAFPYGKNAVEGALVSEESNMYY